jgi:hypothetical protein
MYIPNKIILGIEKYSIELVLPILPILPPSLPLLFSRSHHSCGAGDATSPPLLVVLVSVTSPTGIVDGAATIGLCIGSCLTDAVEGEDQGTVDDTGGIVGEMGEAGLVEDTTLLFG